MKKFISPAGIAAAIGIALLIVVAVIGPLVWGEAAATRSVSERWAPAGPDHLFGTDDLGRDIFARVMAATRLSLLLTAGATAIGVTGGLIIGLGTSIMPKHLRRAVVWVMDMLLAFPWLLLVLFFTVIWGATATGAMLAIGLAGIPNLTRLVYNLSSSVSGKDFVRAARVVGVGPFGVLFRHVLPNISNPLLVQASASASVTLLAFAGLSFLGLGVQAPAYDWGRMLNEGIGQIYINPMGAAGPGLAIVFAGLVFTLISEALADQPGQGVRRVMAASRAAMIPHRIQTKGDLPDPVVVGTPLEPSDPPIAEVTDLRIAFPDGDGGLVERVHGIDLMVRPGETVGIVGESGSGKSLTAMALAGILDVSAFVSAKRRHFDTIDLSEPLTPAERKRLGTEMGYVFQDPLTSLNPALTIGRQMTEVPEIHLGMSRRDAQERATTGLEAVGIADAANRLQDYPHQFSGGMRQRAMIGMALTGHPKLIIADEPTTALDVTVQKQVLGVLRAAKESTDTAVVLISHDIALVAGFCDRVIVMKDGEIIEELSAHSIQETAQHPYTRGLIACLPDMGSDRSSRLPVIEDFAHTVRGDPKADVLETDFREESLL
ncbi:dipeptide/oligopeptide/nickel ABC transporter permease/ATP-binding protein [Brevibacterium sp. FME17]|uniref:dipeptide/oligopeptide/nickel ABC transporter permease/ATP-binding protein n=1 Tax=Brevibacterium sp. FME17 TaxID=2742606 RepID=UPI001867C2D0|nr:dipeptide/oligopeptide/nickel ABC transporter permease/ATP-binding protein [Brevibacterium sp. FME17]